MLDDVDMTSGTDAAVDGPANSSSASPSHASRPPSSAASGSRTPSPKPIIDVDSDSDVEDAPEQPAAPPVVANGAPRKSGASAPASAAPAAKPASAKPKAARPRRSPSRSPPPPVRPPPQTVRLDIPLGGPDKYEIDITDLAKSTGQRPPTPPPVERDTSEGEGEGDDEAEVKDPAKEGKPKRSRRKKKDMYDLEDAFIDDSDLAIDERTFFAQTKQTGFYVSSGEVALLREKTPAKKAKTKRLPLLAISASISSPALKPKPENGAPAAGPSRLRDAAAAVDGTHDTPIPVSDGEDDRAGAKRKAANGVDGDDRSGKKRKTSVRPFHPELEAAMQDLRVAVEKQDWSSKGKFPLDLKPILAEVAVKAIHLNEYDDNFFNAMPRIFPYNRFTMTKLIKRTVFADHVKFLTTRQDQLLAQLRALAAAGLARAQEEYEKALLAWERRQQDRTAAGADGGAPAPPGALSASNSGAGSHSGESTPVPGHTPTPAPAPAPEDAAQTPPDGATAAAAAAAAREREAKPPAKRYKFTDEMKGILWALVCLSNEAVRIENEKIELEGGKKDVSEQGHRKNLYQKIISAFPEGWVSSQQISREVSILKKKAEKEAMEVDS